MTRGSEPCAEWISMPMSTLRQALEATCADRDACDSCGKYVRVPHEARTVVQGCTVARHPADATGPCPRHRWWRNERWKGGLSIRPHTISTLAACACVESVNTSSRVYASHVD